MEVCPALSHHPTTPECVVEIKFESEWALTDLISGNTCHAKFHASKASGSEEDDLYIFLSISMFQTKGHPKDDPF